MLVKITLISQTLVCLPLVQRWGRWVCGDWSTEWNLCVGTQHGIHRYVCVISISDVCYEIMLFKQSSLFVQVIIWTRSGWSRVCTAILGMIFLMYFQNTWPCNDRIQISLNQCAMEAKEVFMCVYALLQMWVFACVTLFLFSLF